MLQAFAAGEESGPLMSIMMTSSPAIEVRRGTMTVVFVYVLCVSEKKKILYYFILFTAFMLFIQGNDHSFLYF